MFCLSVLGRLHVSRQFTLSCLSVSLSVFGRLHMCLGSLLCIVAFLTVYPFLVFNITSWVVPADISSKWLYQTFWWQHVFCCVFLSLRAPLHSWHSPLPRLSYFLVKKCPITYRHIKFHKMNKWIINHWFLQWPWHCIVIWPWQFDHSSSSKTKYNVYIGPCKRTSQTYL